MASLQRSQIEEIKDKLDIQEVAQNYLGNLKKSGANYFALCPFHNEKTPSFSINPQMGIFKCFGCGESGDVITFIEKMEGVEFVKALEIAAKQAGVQLKKTFSKEEARAYRQKQTILKLNSLVSEYYHYILTKHPKGEKGRTFAKDRKVTKDLIEKFQVGYAPRGFSNLITFLKGKGHKISDLIRWGLAVSRGGRVYDKFRSRLIFPLINHHGDIIGFSGRTILKNTRAPKYLHSPKTPVFDKGRFLFGLEQAKRTTRSKDFIVFCEGQLDVISSHKTKVSNVVASLGTSLTSEQLELAKRYSKNVYFAFDNDLAGEKALIRSSQLAHSVGVSVKAVSISQGADADELINKDRKEWEKAVINAESFIDHMIKRLYKRLDLSKISEKEELVSILLPLIATIPKKIEQVYFLHKVAVILNIDEEILREELDTIQLSRSYTPQVRKDKIKKMLESPLNAKEEYLLSLIFQHPQFIDTSLEIVRPRYLSSSASKLTFEKFKNYQRTKQRISLKNFIRSLDDTQKDFVSNILLKKLDQYFELEKDFREEISGVLQFIKKNYYQNQLRKVKVKIEEAEKSKNKKDINILTKKLKKITKKIGKM